MDVAIRAGLRLAGSVKPKDVRPTAHQIAPRATTCELELAGGGRLHVCQPQAFAALRELAGVPHEAFFESLTQDELQGGGTASSGKSGATFWTSKDGRYIVKTVAEEELSTLLLILPKYARHLMEHRDSLLTRYLGAYRLSQGGRVTAIVIMMNVLEGAVRHKVYDLKGTTEDRWVEESDGRCLKDLNFRPITLRTSDEVSQHLHAMLQADTRFLERLRIMDYSLVLSLQYLDSDARRSSSQPTRSGLAGSHEGTACTEFERKPCIFQCGLVDMLTTFDFKKQVAHALKSNTIGHLYDIDTEPPDVYGERFRCYLTQKIVGGAGCGRSTTGPATHAAAAPELSPVPQAGAGAVDDLMGLEPCLAGCGERASAEVPRADVAVAPAVDLLGLDFPPDLAAQTSAGAAPLDLLA